jgi:CDP-diacylglycerol--glycerol-3-phosphate 3-phosphatidyltransferase
MITDRARELSRGLVVPVATFLKRLGFTPNGVTMAGTLLHVLVAVVLATGHLRWGGLLLALAAAFDGLDGTVARLSGGGTPFGAFLDSTMDRISELMVFGGLLWYVTSEPAPSGCAWCAYDPILVLAAIGGSLMVSYTRARSEGIGHATKAGVLGRLERTAIMVVALLLGLLRPGLALVALGAWLTTAQRILDVRRQCLDAGRS